MKMDVENFETISAWFPKTEAEERRDQRHLERAKERRRERAAARKAESAARFAALVARFKHPVT